MSPENTQVVQRFASWIKVQGLSQSEAAKLIGSSPATLSQVLSGSYAGDVARYVDKMSRALDRADRRAAAPRRPGFAETSVVQEVLATLRSAHDEGNLVVVLGEPGVGKSEACRCYHIAEPETILITLIPWDRRDKPRPVRPVLIEIAGALGLPIPVNASSGDLVKLVSQRLTGSGRLIIVDEIDYAHEGMLQVLRSIHDAAAVGIALIATPAFLAHLRRRKSATLNQLLSRISDTCAVGHITDEDCDLLLAGYKLDAAARAAARMGAHGSARRLIYGLVRAQRLAVEEKSPLDAKTIARAYAQLMEA